MSYLTKDALVGQTCPVLTGDMERAFDEKRLEELMAARGWDSKELHHQTRFNQRTIDRYLDGTSQPGSPHLRILAIVLDTSADFLLGLTDDRSPSERVEEATRIARGS